MYPSIHPLLRSGSEPVHSSGTPSGQSLLDFWRWQGSNLLDNALRGVLAEFLVASALGATDQPRVEWDGYDCLTKDGIKVEVKSSAYIQSWAQEELSKISFDIAPKQAWEASTNTYSETPKRSADVYVFCLHAHKDQDTIDPLDLDQWEFYVVSTSIMNERCPTQKTIVLGAMLEKLEPVKCGYGEIRQAVESVQKEASGSGDSLRKKPEAMEQQ